MESLENNTTVGGYDNASTRSEEILFNDVEYDRKFRTLQAYLPFVDNLLLQSSGKIASDRLQSLRTMLNETNTKMKYDVMAKCESVLQSLMKKMEAAHNGNSIDAKPRMSTVQTSVVTQPVPPGATTSTVTSKVQSVTENLAQLRTGLEKSSVKQTNGHNEQQARHSLVSNENSVSQISSSSLPTLGNNEHLAVNMTKLDPENRSMVLTLKRAAARTARNAETTQQVSKRVPITWDDTSSKPTRKSEIDTLKLAAARTARFAEPLQKPDSRRVNSTQEPPKDSKGTTVNIQTSSDISTLKLAAERTAKQIDHLSTGSDVETNISDQERPDSLQMSRDKLKKLISPSPNVIGEKDTSPPHFLGTKFDLDSPRNDWDFQAAPESSSHWNPPPPIQDSTNWTAGGDSESNATSSLKLPKSSESDQIPSQACDDRKTSAGSIHGSATMASFYSPVLGLVQRRVSTGPDSPLSPDESGPNSVEAKRRLRDKLSQEIHMVHRVGTSKGGSLRGLAAKESKVPSISSKESNLAQDKKAGFDGVKKSEKIVEIDMFSKELAAPSKVTVSDHAKESPKVLKGLYAPRYKSSQENSSAKSGIVRSEQKPTSRSSIDASRLMKSPPGDTGLKKLVVTRAESRDVTGSEKLPEAASFDAAGTHSKIFSTMTTEELKRAVHMNVRNLPSPPKISALILESGKTVPTCQPEKVILNPAFNNAPPLIEPGFFSKSDVDLRLQDPSGFHSNNSDTAIQQKNTPQNANNRDPRMSYVSRFDRESPMSPDGNNTHELGHEVGPGPRHITYHLNNVDVWQGSSSSGRSQNNQVGCSPTEESFLNQYPPREGQWTNGGHRQLLYDQGDMQVPLCEERNYQKPSGDRLAMQIPRGEARDRHFSGDNRDFRGPQFHARNFHQPMGNLHVPQTQQEHVKSVNQFSMDDSRGFQGPNFYIGPYNRSADIPRLMQNTGRKMQGDDGHKFHGPPFSGRGPVLDQRGVLGQVQGRMINPLLASDSHLHEANYQGRNAYHPTFESQEQQVQRIQGRNMNHQPLMHNHDFSMEHNQGQKPHPPMNECHNQRPGLLLAPQHSEVPCAQGSNRDPRNRESPRPETNKYDKFHWQNSSLSTPAAAPSPKLSNGPQSASIPILSPTGLEKDRPVHRPLSPLPTTTPHVDQILANPDCIPFNPPRILDPRIASKSAGHYNEPPKDSSRTQYGSQLPAGSNKQRKQRNSWLDSSQRRYGKESSRRSSWEAEEARRREERRKSVEQNNSHKRQQDKDDSSKLKLANKGELVSPLNSLYGSTIIQKTGVGYGIQKFKIPKIKQPGPPKKVEPEVPTVVTSVGAENTLVPELPVGQTTLEQKAEKNNMSEQKCDKLPPVEQTPHEQQPIEQTPAEQPATEQSNPEKPHVEHLPLPAPLIVKAFMQQSNVDVNQLLENLKLIGNLKPNRLKKFQNILMNSSSSDDSDVDTSSTTIKKDSKLKTSKKIVGGEQKQSEGVDSKETDAICAAGIDPSANSNTESEKLKLDYCEDKKIEVPTRKLRGRKPGPLSAKIKDRGSNCEALEPPTDLDLVTEAAPKPRMTRTRRRNSLEILQADIKDMHISEGVLSASGRRICTTLKKEEALTAAAKELPKKNTGNLDGESDFQTAISKKKKTPNTSKKGLRKAEEKVVPASRRSGRYLKDIERSISSSDGGDVSDVDGPDSDPAVENSLDSDEDRIEPQDVTAETMDVDLQKKMPKPRKRIPMKRRQNLKEKKLAVTAASSASEDDEEIVLPAKTKRKKNQKKMSTVNLILSDVECESTDKSSTAQENADNDSSPITKKKVTKTLKLCDSSDSCIESITPSISMSSTSEEIDIAIKKIQNSPKNKKISVKSTAVNPSVNLSAFVKLQKMPISSIKPIPIPGCSSDESSEVIPLTAFVKSKSRQVARRGGRSKGPRSRLSQQITFGHGDQTSEFDSRIPSEEFPKPGANGSSDDAYHGESISDIIERLSKDDDYSKRAEVDDIPDEGTAGTKETVSGTKSVKKKRRSNWSLGVIKKKRPIKSCSPEAVNLENLTKKVDISLNDSDFENNEVLTVDEFQEVDLEPDIVGSIQKEGEEPAVCVESESAKISALPSVDLLVPALADEADKNTSDQKFVKSPVVPIEVCSTESIRNVDKTYFVSHNLKSRKYLCKLCNWNGTAIVSHYAVTHPDQGVFISRLSDDAAKICIAESQEKGYGSAEDPEVEPEKPAKRKTNPFTCRMCFFKCTNFAQFYDHCCGHTGEYRYKCTQCFALIAGKLILGAHYQYHHKELRTSKEKYTEVFPMPPPKANGAFAYICPLCNFVQMCKSNVVKHLKVHHAQECDTVKIVCFNMHVDTDKKRIALRKRNKNNGESEQDHTMDASTETNHESENGNKTGVNSADETQIVNLAAFLPSDQESLSRTDTELDPSSKDLVDESTVLCFASKLMPDNQNSLIDDLIRRTENLGEGKDNTAPNQTNPVIPDGVLDSQLPSESLLADEMSQDSCLSDSTLTDDILSSEPPIGTTDLMEDIIKRLEESTAADMSENVFASKKKSGVVMEEIPDLNPARFVGPFEVREVDNFPVFSCYVDSCNFSAVSADTFISHLKYNHTEETWDGVCQTCCNLVVAGEITDVLTAFLHLLKCHLSVECETVQYQIALHEQIASQQDPLALSNAAENFPGSRQLNEKNFFVMKEKDDDEDAMNMCVIENVVSLATTTNDMQDEPPHLPPVITKEEHLSYPAENIDVQKLDASSPIVKSPSWQLPSIMRSPPKLIPRLKVPNIIPTTVQNPISKTRSKRKASLLDGEHNAVEQDRKVQQKALVQCLKAKAEKEPTTYVQMLERSKLRHLFKCMARSCSYSSNNAVDFGRHRAEHKEEECECCAYCMKTFTLDHNRELVSHVQLEHGHCTFQCAYCFYRAVCPSYVFVHQNLSHTNKSISILQCLGSAESNQQSITLSEAVPRYVCGQSDCSETFLLTEQFILHLHESHTQIHNYSCHLCDTVCFDSRNFIAHYRIHSLHLYQCRYCVHGTSNEEAMHHHLCNVHPGQSPKIVMREAHNVGGDRLITVNDLKIVDLGEKNAVSDSLIVKLSITEMVDEVEKGRLMIIEPVSSEGEEPESDTVLLNTSNETESIEELLGNVATVEDGCKAEDVPAPLPAEPICIIDLDSEDDVGGVEMAGSPDERTLRSLRTSPRKPTAEADGSERRPRLDKRPAVAKEEVKPRATTSFEFGAITLEDLNETGLSGQMLFKCGFSTCETRCETVEELREHLMVCDHSRNSHGLFCPHCKRPIKNLVAFSDHIRSHSTCRYGCGLCLFRSTAAKPVQAHLRSRHRIATTKCIPLNPLKGDPENDLFVVGPLRPDKRKNHLVSQIQSPDKKSRPKYVYQPDEGHLLPIGAIYPFIVTCATCSFTTKVRKNMERHLTLHKMDYSVPSQNPVNAVPCLEAKEMMFDKMTNLAASSNLKAPDATNLYLTPEDFARLPKFVPEQQRYSCGEQNCTYNSCDENMLLYHLQALHRDVDYYNCPHCLNADEPDEENGDVVSRILIEKLSLHLKMHDNRLYKCGYCFYYDHRRYIVERHVTDKHSDYKMHVNVVREPFSEGTPVVSAKSVEKETAKELAPRYAWKCSRCEFESVTRGEMVNHSDKEHGKKLQYECGLCHNRFQSKQSFDQHCGFKHPGLKEQLLFNFFKIENVGAAVVEAAFDTRPLWSRESNTIKHIRGIFFEEEPTKLPKEVPIPEPPTLPADEPPSKEAMFLCSICKVFETKVKADMKIHLYKELKYFRYQCTFCDKKVFSLTAGKKHMARAHASTDSGTALTLFEKDLETEQKVEEILAAQEDLMQLDNPSKPTRHMRSYKSKSLAVRAKDVAVPRVKEVEKPATLTMPLPTVVAKEVPDEGHESDISVGVEDSDEDRSQSGDVTLQQEPPSKTLECKECSQLFHSVRGLKVHIRLSHLSLGKWKCNMCQLTHRSSTIIKRHSKSAHPNSTIDPPYSLNSKRLVDFAGKTNDYWQSVWGIKSKAGKSTANSDASDTVFEPEERFKCPHCEAHFTTISQRNRHEQRHLVQKPYNCGHCGFNAISSLVVKRHSEKIHPRLAPLVEKLDLSEKNNIVPINSRQKRKQTLKVKKSFDELPTPPAKKTRLESEIIELDSDDESTIVASATDTLATVESLQHFKCFYCPLLTETRGVMHEHWLREHKDPRFANDGDIYPDTGVSFHMETIDGAVPSLKCSEPFGSHAALIAHSKSVRPVLCDIECPKCDFKTRCAETMGSHLHQHDFEFKCTLCGNSFINKTHAGYHWEIAHPDDPFKANSFVLNLDQYESLQTLVKKSVRMVKNVAKKSTTKMPRTGDFYARKSTGNAPWRRGLSIAPKKAKPPAFDLRNLTVKVPIGSSEIDMRVDTCANFYNINAKIVLVDCKIDPLMKKHFPNEECK